MLNERCHATLLAGANDMDNRITKKDIKGKGLTGAPLKAKLLGVRSQASSPF